MSRRRPFGRCGDQAVAAYDRALTGDPARASTYALRAHAYDQKGDRKRAMANIDRAIKLASQANFLELRGILRLQDGDLDGALRDAESILKSDPGAAAGLALRVAVSSGKMKYDRARLDLDQALKRDPKNALAYSERGQIYQAQAEPERALSDLNRAILLGPVGVEPYRARAAIYEAKGQPDLALSCRPGARARRRRQPYRARGNQARQRRDRGRHRRLRCRFGARCEQSRRPARARRGADPRRQFRQGHRRSRPRPAARYGQCASLLPARRRLRPAGRTRQGDGRL